MLAFYRKQVCRRTQENFRPKVNLIKRNIYSCICDYIYNTCDQFQNGSTFHRLILTHYARNLRKRRKFFPSLWPHCKSHLKWDFKVTRQRLKNKKRRSREAKRERGGSTMRQQFNLLNCTFCKHPEGERRSSSVTPSRTIPFSLRRP